MARKNGAGPRGIVKYNAYNFRDKDPQIDELRTLLEQKYGRRVDYSMLQDTRDEGGPSVGCMAGWFFKDTRSPKNDTLESAGRANGFRRKWVRDT